MRCGRPAGGVPSLASDPALCWRQVSAPGSMLRLTGRPAAAVGRLPAPAQLRSGYGCVVCDWLRYTLHSEHHTVSSAQPAATPTSRLRPSLTHPTRVKQPEPGLVSAPVLPYPHTEQPEPCLQSRRSKPLIAAYGRTGSDEAIRSGSIPIPRSGRDPCNPSLWLRDAPPPLVITSRDEP